MNTNLFSKYELSELEALEVRGGSTESTMAQNQCVNYSTGCGAGVDQNQCINKATGCGSEGGIVQNCK